ncbi:methanogenesis marker 17 protein [Methanobacterium spitsbergense]|uniref:Methanogenesis marker 17 protein n=1 Tax=Methanobacterium spitsbergense TaxID=2874285 RepID=A0A8T5UZA8_9EURY|nr:methanogenesis marker 17 protein [Methanobacterium spitsbergense]MBZ2166133.1 methanogenesis marker 17 protein [Methanobacterium spitsbergense]
MKVECYDENGAEVYDMIIRHILQEVQVSRSIGDLRVYVDPREPIFIIVVKLEKASQPIVIDDFAEYKFNKEGNEMFIKINDETYLPDLLEKLWKTEGRNKIHQPNRFEVIIDDPQTELKGMVVRDPQDDLRNKVYDAIFRIIPEGFRVIDHKSVGNIIALTCTDEIMKDEWLRKTDEIIEEVKNE